MLALGYETLILHVSLTRIFILQSRHPVVVVSLLDELIQRDCLAAALSSRDEVSLEVCFRSASFLIIVFRSMCV